MKASNLHLTDKNHTITNNIKRKTIGLCLAASAAGYGCTQPEQTPWIDIPQDFSGKIELSCDITALETETQIGIHKNEQPPHAPYDADLALKNGYVTHWKIKKQTTDANSLTTHAAMDCNPDGTAPQNQTTHGYTLCQYDTTSGNTGRLSGDIILSATLRTILTSQDNITVIHDAGAYYIQGAQQEISYCHVKSLTPDN